MPLFIQNKQIDCVILTTELFSKYSHLTVSAMTRPGFPDSLQYFFFVILYKIVFVFPKGKCQNISLQTSCVSGSKVPAVCTAA